MKKLLQSLHEHFIPSERNSFQPRFLRLKASAGILGLVLVLEAIYLTATLVVIPRNGSLAAIFASVLVDQTNHERTTDNLHGLAINETLVRAAQMKADDMAAKGYFAHYSPDGKTPWYWFDQAGYNYAAAGENLAVNFTDSKDVTSAWMHSESHRANILNGNYTEIGIATANGTYKGRNAIFVVQEFGRPSLIARVTNTPSTSQDSIEALVASSTRTQQIVRSITPLSQIQTPRPITSTRPTTPASTSPVAVSSTGNRTAVAGAETEKLNLPVDLSLPEPLPPAHVSVLRTMLASPRSVTTTFYLILLGIVLTALGLAVFIKIRIQYPHIIANGVLLVAIILSLIVFNVAVGSWQGVV